MTWRGVDRASELLKLLTTLPQVMKDFLFLMLAPPSFKNPMSFRLLPVLVFKYEGTRTFM